jgi:ATP-dependent DNA ligase
MGKLLRSMNQDVQISNMLQSFRSQASHIHYFIFDLLVCNDRDLTRLPLSERRKLMKSFLKLRSPRMRICEQFETSATDMLTAVRQQQLEGVIGKRKDSLYEPGKRTGAWIKCRVNRGQELVIGGYIPGPHGFDSLIVGLDLVVIVQCLLVKFSAKMNLGDYGVIQDLEEPVRFKTPLRT